MTYYDICSEPDTRHPLIVQGFDTDRDYGTEHAHVFFYIKSENYNSARRTFETEIAKKQWNSEFKKITDMFGYARKRTVHKAYLSGNPESINGIIPKNDIRETFDAINNSAVMTVEYADIRETCYVMTDSEYKAYLETKSDEIKHMLYDICFSGTSNGYYEETIIRIVAENVKLTRCCVKNKNSFGLNQTTQFVRNIADQMVTSNIIRAYTKEDGTKYLRRLTAQEQYEKNIDKHWSRCSKNKW